MSKSKDSLVSAVLSGGPFDGRKYKVREDRSNIRSPLLEPSRPAREAVYEKAPGEEVPLKFEYRTTTEASPVHGIETKKSVRRF